MGPAGDAGPITGTRPENWCSRHPGRRPERARPFPRIVVTTTDGSGERNDRYGHCTRGGARRRRRPRLDGTIDINAALRSLLEGLLNAVMDARASELGVPRRTATASARSTPASGGVTLEDPQAQGGGRTSPRTWSRAGRGRTRPSPRPCATCGRRASRPGRSRPSPPTWASSRWAGPACRGCARGSTARWRSCGARTSPPRSGRTCGSTPPTCRAARPARRGRWRSSPRWRCSGSARRRVVGIECIDTES